MSREDKQLRRKHRLEKKNRRGMNRAWLGGMENIDLPEGFRYVSYDITLEPLETPEEPNHLLEEATANEGGLEALNEQLYAHPAETIPKLQRLIELNPDIPLTYNWLQAAYSLVGNEEEANRMTELTYEKFPNYLFARTTYANLCMHRNQVDRVPAIFDGGKFELKALYPHRNVFHLTEFLAFAATMVQYFLRTDKRDQAEVYLEMMEEMAPEHSVTVQTRKIATHLTFLLALERLKNWIPGRRRRAGRKGSKKIDLPTDASKGQESK